MGLASVVVNGPLFIYGPLGFTPILRRILGPEGVGHLRIAHLPGFEVTSTGEAAIMAGLAPGAGQAEGWFVSDRDAVQRLSYVAEVFDLGAPIPVTVDHAGLCAEAQTFPGHPGACRWHQGAWAERWGDLLATAADELTELAAEFEAGQMAGRVPMILSRAAARLAAKADAPADLRSATPASGVEEYDSAITHAGFFLSRDYTLSHPRFDGTMSAPLRREVFVATDAALVLPYDPASDRVLLVEQFRMGPYGRGDAR
ncbi:MAG: tellurium resistance protein, partial [Roseovarius sp.]|nr:tellurium resistance protein [Roseovarius sp.]